MGQFRDVQLIMTRRKDERISKDYGGGYFLPDYHWSDKLFCGMGVPKSRTRRRMGDRNVAVPDDGVSYRVYSAGNVAAY
jgi:hypothetical protein